MIPIIMDTSFQKIGLIDDYVSFIWCSRYYATGDFELVVNVDSANSSMLQKDFYVMRETDDNVGIIENIQITVNEDDSEIMIVTGRFLSSILGRRIIEKQTQLNATVSAGVFALITNEAIAPVNNARKIPNLIYKYNTISARLQAQYTGDNLLETIEKICEAYGVGQKTTLTTNNEFMFELYEGIDRSYNQTVNPYVIFSDEYDNLISSDYQEKHDHVITDVLVAGEGEGTARKSLWVSNFSNSGLNRYEAFKDQRQLSTNNGEVSESEYLAQLKESGLEDITTFTTAFTGQVYFDNIEYRKDVNIGDICVIENSRWGVYINTRLIEVIESVDEGGKYTVTPTFGV